MQTDEVQALLDNAYRAMATEQLDLLLELYTEDALIQSAGEAPVIGKEAITHFWQTTFLHFRVNLSAMVQECTALSDAVVVRGRAVGTFEPKQENPTVPVQSWFLQIYRRGSDGRLHFWRGANGPAAARP